MPGKERLEQYLHDNQVSFQIEHHQAVFSALDIAKVLHIPSRMVVKVVIIQVDNEMLSMVLSASKRVDFHKVQVHLKAQKIRLAREAEFFRVYNDCEVGAMPPFGNLYNIPVYVEQKLTQEKTILCRCGTHTDAMRLKYADFARLVTPKVLEFATT